MRQADLVVVSLTVAIAGRVIYSRKRSVNSIKDSVPVADCRTMDLFPVLQSVPMDQRAAHKVNQEDPEPEKTLLERTLLNGLGVQSIKLGDHLGLYEALYEAQCLKPDGYATFEDVYKRTGADRRLLLTWLQFQVKMKYLTQVVTNANSEESYEEDDDESKDYYSGAPVIKYRLEPEMARYLLPSSHSDQSMMGEFHLATCMMDLRPVINSFETGKQQLFLSDEPVPVKFEPDLFSSRTVENRIRAARESFGNRFFRHRFVETVLAKIERGEDIINRLERGDCDVAEVFCGATSGTLSISLASRFRSARCFGFDSSNVTLTRARDLAHAAECKNARFYDIHERSVSFGPPPSTSKRRKVRPGYGLVVTFMSMSMIDTANQLAVFQDIRAGLDLNGGTWIIMDLNATEDDVAYALCLGMSLLHFLPGLESPQKCQMFNEARCRELASHAGLRVVESLTVVGEMMMKMNVFVLKV